MKIFKRILLFILFASIVAAGIYVYLNKDRWMNEKKLSEILSEEKVKSIKENDDTELALSLVSSDSFESSNIDRYIKYSKDTNLDTDKDIQSLLDEEYYLYKNTNRYMNYYKEHKDLKASAIITNVNSNIDYAFYTNTKKTDLSKGNLILVNKYNYLDEDYVPNLVDIDSEYGDWGSLTPDAYEAFKVMVAGAKEDGIKLFSCSPYRSYELQSSLYHRYGARDGYDKADTYSARPGSSEHQTGLAIDINAADDWFNDTKEAKWLANNAYKYGFILRYPKGKEYLTGYQYESWHYRYVGKEVAKYIFEHDITFEEYYAYFIEK